MRVWKAQTKAMLTTFQLHGTCLDVHRKVLQIHRAGQDESQPTMQDKVTKYDEQRTNQLIFFTFRSSGTLIEK